MKKATKLRLPCARVCSVNTLPTAPASLVFFGTSEFAVPILEWLRQAGCQIKAVVTQPDKRADRNQLAQSPIKTAAQHLGLRVEQPAKAQEALAWLKDLKPDLVIVTAYGQILPSALLRLPRFGAVNLHPSLLPKYRGPSPIQTAILNGDKQTGTTLMLLNDKLDQGPILAQTKIAIAPADTYLTLSQKLAQLSIELLEKTLPLYLAGKLKPKPQKEAAATFCKMIKRQDGLIDWQKSAIEIQRQLRAFTPWPGLYTLWSRQPNRWRLKIIALSQGPATIQPAGTVFEFNKKPALACGNQTSVIINIIQPEGKREMKGEEFLRGYRDFVGSNLA